MNKNPEILDVYNDEEADTIIWYDLDEVQHVEVKDEDNCNL